MMDEIRQSELEKFSGTYSAKNPANRAENGVSGFRSEIACFLGQICVVFWPVFSGFARYFAKWAGKKIANFFEEKTLALPCHFFGLNRFDFGLILAGWFDLA